MFTSKGLFSVLALVSATCRREAPADHAPPTVVVPAASESAGAAMFDAGALPPKGEWQDAIRLGRWDEAARILDALSSTEKETPALKLVRARVAIERAEYAAAVPLLEGLERDLPLEADLIAKMRARAELEVGPYAPAGEYFYRGTSASAWMKAARAFEKANDPRVRTAIDRVIAASPHDVALQAEARALRLRLPPEPDVPVASDARWVATTGAGTKPAADTLSALAKLDPTHPLTGDEWLVRAKAFGEAGKLDDALHAIDQIAHAPDAAKVAPQQRLHAKAMILYHARNREADAALVFGSCAAERGPLAAECAFHAARSLSRADRDPEAIRAYADVAKRFPATTWGGEARFYGPYLEMLHGAWRRAAAGFDTYLKEVPAGNDRHEAKRYRGLCHLLAQDFNAARRELENASADESDPVASARISNMAALAALGDGDRLHAVALWMKAATSVPLSWPALVARARLAKIGANAPPYFGAAPPPEAPAAVNATLPPAVLFLHGLGLDDEAESALHDRESSILANAGGRNAEALCTAYGELGRAERRFQASRQVPGVLVSAPLGPSNAWAWSCLYPAPYPEIVQTAEKAEELPVGLIYAVMRQESAFHPEATSGAHAVGLLQLVSETASVTAKSLGLPPDDARLTSPPYNIRIGARHLHDVVSKFHGNVPFALGAYNAGSPPLERWLSRSAGMEIDTFVERIPYRETRDYIVRVMGNWAHYAYIRGGEAAVPALDLALPSPAK